MATKSPQARTRRRGKRGESGDADASHVLPADIAAQIPAGRNDKVRMKLNAEWTSDGPPVGTQTTGEVIEETDGEPIDPDSLVDPLTDFLTAWGAYAEMGYQLSLVRRPDAHMAGRFYVACDELEPYGQIPFRPTTIIADIQKYFGHSGGRARVSLKDNQAKFITGAHCNFTVPNPLERKPPEQPQTAQTATQQQPPVVQKDALTLALEQALVAKIRRDAEGLLNPGGSTQPSAAGFGGVDAEKFAVAKFLMGDAGVRDSVVKNLVGAATGKAGDPELSGWQWIVYQTINSPDAMRALAPLIAPLLGIIPALLSRLGMNGKGFQTVTHNPNNGAINVQPTQPRPPAAGLPQQSTAFAPAASSYVVEDEATDEEEETDSMRDVYYLALDAVIDALQADSPVSNDAPWVVAMKESFPEQIKQALGMVKIFDVDTIKSFLLTQDSNYAAPLNLPHARAWLAQFKAAVDNGQLTDALSA